MAEKTCPRCDGFGWVCEEHPHQPMNHVIDVDGQQRECGGAGMPCAEPDCPFRTHPPDADAE